MDAGSPPFWPAAPLIGAAGLCLRPLSQADIPSLVDVTHHPSVVEAISFLRAPFTAADARQLLASHATGRDVWFGIFEDGQLAGVVGCHASDARRGDAAQVEIGYWLAPAARGRGLARAAAGLVRDWARQVRPASTLMAECRPDNLASWRVLCELGFVPTGEKGSREGRDRLVWRPISGS